MIYAEGLNSYIESIYLEDELDTYMTSDINIHVNPNNPTYIIGKIVILNINNYPKDKINILIKNRCKIISRVFYDSLDIEICPYIFRPCFDIMWNGKEFVATTEEDLKSIEDNSKEDVEWSIMFPDYKLYFPKVTFLDENIVKDGYGNLTGLGWISQQVGINLIEDTLFTDLDLVKTKKLDYNK